MKTTFKILMSLLAFHLLFINSELLIKLTFNRLDLTLEDWYYAIPLVLFAASYGFATVIILNSTNSLKLIIAAASIDAFGTFIDTVIGKELLLFTILTGVYFTIYTFYLISVTGFLKTANQDRNTNIETEKKEIKLMSFDNYFEKQRSLQNSINRCTKDMVKKGKLQEELDNLNQNYKLQKQNLIYGK